MKSFDEIVLPTELECCYNEFKYYQKSNNKIAALGWAVSYQLQALWQNSPKIDTIQNYHLPIKQNKANNSQAEQRLKEIQNFLQSKDIEPFMLHYTPYPKNTQIKFYTTLTWDKFYSHFPTIKRLSEKLHTKENIYTQNFVKQIEKILTKTHNILILKNLPKGEYKFNFAIDIRENRSNNNEESYIIIEENNEISKDYKRVLACKPYELDTLNCQYISINDNEFLQQIWQNLGINIAEQFDLDFATKNLVKNASLLNRIIFTYANYHQAMQDLSLYACSGKFSFNFVPSKLSIKKEIQGNREKVLYRVDEMFVYIYDSFDFLDQGHEFDDDGNFIKLGQPVGAWDFNEKSFSIWGSVKQMETYDPKLHIIPQITFEDVLNSPKTKQYYLYNQDYQDYQKFTPYGLDFKIYSEDFIAKLDFKDKAYNVLYDMGV